MLGTSTTDWFEPTPYVTPIEVMSETQEPFLEHNSWKYSNHGLARCYPPYDYNPKKNKPPAPWNLNGFRKAAKAES
jgi:hypothetical protein